MYNRQIGYTQISHIPAAERGGSFRTAGRTKMPTGQKETAMALKNTINVNGDNLPANVLRVLQGLKQLGFDKAGEPYVTTSDSLAKMGISAMNIRSLVTTTVHGKRDQYGNAVQDTGTIMKRVILPRADQISDQSNEIGFMLNYDLI
ncbi:hypothetical protein [Microvirgula aerodenitrificans]|uniref:hypothetical protein n=1 Tax=Microvirgula aerodenitrificans TaxID=57480 RepID=UPI00248D4EC4|nr:hypothetical protein [Microvirgula aerodenitrificans]